MMLKRKKNALLLIGIAIVLALIAGCSPVSYYMQAMHGQLDILRRSESVNDLAVAEQTDTKLKQRLKNAKEIRDFASRELGLPDNGSYRQYANLDRPYVVWNVFAAEALSIKPVEWCFPVAGCVGYRGYFSETDAQSYASRLRSQGLDVHIGGVPAYSTLGWFDDPLLNTFIHYPETELARLIFHELSHQLIYASGDAEFNESFASTVEQEGVRRWIAYRNNPQLEAAFDAAQTRREDFYVLVLEFREKLGTLYASDLSAEQKHTGKMQLLSELKTKYREVRSERWGGFPGYDRWFGQEINNATLASVGIYRKFVPAFQTMLKRCNNQLPCFYNDIRELAALPKPERHARLNNFDNRAANLTR